MNTQNPELESCPNVLLSINPEHAEAILDGEKRYEYRRVPPARGPPVRLVLYATAPVQAAVGVAWSHTYKEGPPARLASETAHHTPSTKDDVLNYFEGMEAGTALQVDSYRRFDAPVSVTELEDSGYKPSQNFRYLGTVPADEQLVEPAAVTPEPLEV